MLTNSLTPAQSYAKSAVDALDAFIAAEPEAKYSASSIAQLLMERPKTLRCALAAYLYKSKMQSLNRR